MSSGNHRVSMHCSLGSIALDIWIDIAYWEGISQPRKKHTLRMSYNSDRRHYISGIFHFTHISLADNSPHRWTEWSTPNFLSKTNTIAPKCMFCKSIYSRGKSSSMGRYGPGSGRCTWIGTESKKAYTTNISSTTRIECMAICTVSIGRTVGKCHSGKMRRIAKQASNINLVCRLCKSSTSNR